MEHRTRKRKLRPYLSAGLLVILGGMMMLGLFGCGNASYTVDYRGQKDEYRNARDTYRAGQKVRLTYYLIGTDTDYSFYLDGERLNPDYKEGKGFILEFTMPDHDVELECRAVNSMMRTTDDDPTEGDMLVDYYVETVAADGGNGYTELVLYAYTSDQVKLVVYGKDDPDDTESSTTYIVPYAAYDRCCDVMDDAKMRTWNDDPDQLCSEDGARTVCKFRDTDGSYVCVTSEATPEDGAQAFAALRNVLQSYVSDAYRE